MKKSMKKSMRKNHKTIFYFICLCLFATACDDCVFTSRNTTIVNFRFYRKTNRLQALTPTFYKVQTGVGVSIEPKDTVRLTATSRTLSIRLHPFQDTSTFYFSYPNRKDAITFQYQRTYSTTSPRCGYDQKIDKFEVLKHSFDSIAIFKPDLEIGDTVNVRVYLR